MCTCVIQGDCISVLSLCNTSPQNLGLKQHTLIIPVSLGEDSGHCFAGSASWSHLKDATRLSVGAAFSPQGSAGEGTLSKVTCLLVNSVLYGQLD